MPIIIGGAGGGCLLLSCLVAFIIYRRRRKIHVCRFFTFFFLFFSLSVLLLFFHVQLNRMVPASLLSLTIVPRSVHHTFPAFYKLLRFPCALCSDQNLSGFRAHRTCMSCIVFVSTYILYIYTPHRIVLRLSTDSLFRIRVSVSLIRFVCCIFSVTKHF